MLGTAAGCVTPRRSPGWRWPERDIRSLPASFVSMCWLRRPSALHPSRCARCARGSLASDERDAAPPLGRPAAARRRAAPRARSPRTWYGVRPAGDGWVLSRLREAARRQCRAARQGRGRAVEPRAGGAAPARARVASFVRPLARRRAPGGRPRACTWRRRYAWPQIRESAPRSRSRWPKRTRRCSGGWTRWT